MAKVRVKEELVYPGSFACPGCGLMMAFRHVLRVLGRNTAVVTTAGCGSVVAGSYPQTISKVPFFHCSFGTAASTAAGLKAGYDMMGKRSINVLAWAGDGGTFDIGLQSLSGAAERNEDIIYVCYDNEAYMNTGVQRSSGTPMGAWTTTTPRESLEDRPKKKMAAIMAAHEIPYIATASVSYPEDLDRKIRKAKGIKGFRFIHIIVPCPTGWLYPASETVRLGREAVLSRIFPLFEIMAGKKYRLSPMGAKTPVREYLVSQGRFKGLSEKDISLIQEKVDEYWSELEELAARSRESHS
ncbi:MAG: pyruvate synthase subunit beta [Deltaproteobacteria bacterium]|nr:pyruvate synthase subunit beta [Deltaproteobacteria bacterium]MBW1936575.1 pyruvate synthase subunit beta [Deltaproteobacteria bacterium]MBW1977735.1 pyruvate synthase subunit beta [Deltaproteobacteria bacterium]MBW2043449.1 pyruvate synthase subunit beta [Deltaproteobacteria bacterium]MBW2299431.1 pyruvate synthase subunit beta [Deltaproteobacteria bacterium]